MVKPDEKNAQQIQIELDEKISGGEYSNLVIVTHSPADFIFDFTQIMPGMPKARVRARIIMAPIHAKAFARALMDNIQKYESRFGEIQIADNDWLKEMGFQPPKGSLPN